MLNYVVNFKEIICMITYVYLVKCPNCDDEYFDFFKEAEAYALGKLSEKPIITQTEVNRNDFGECTNHCDLGTVWSWEDVVGDQEKECSDTPSLLTKDFLDNIDSDTEFDGIDNSVDFEPNVSSNFRKPIPEGMTIEELVEAMEENEDTVECAKCGGLFEKASCTHNTEGFGWCCTNCEPKDDLVEEDRDLGNTYDGGYPEEYDLAALVKDSINHLTNDLGKDPWADDFADDVIADLENNYSIYVPADVDKYGIWCSDVASEVSRQVNSSYSLTEGFSWIKAGDRFTLVTDSGNEQYVVVTTYDKEYEKHLDKYERFIQIAKETPNGTFEDPFDIEYAVLADYKNHGKLLFESKSFLEELEDSEAYHAHLDLCPECGKENSFDHEAGFCLECGFSILDEELSDEDIDVIANIARSELDKANDKIEDELETVKKDLVQHHELMAKCLMNQHKEVLYKLDKHIQ